VIPALDLWQPTQIERIKRQEKIQDKIFEF